MADSTQLSEPREPGALARSADFLTAVRVEMRKVTWPSRDELKKATRMIVVLSLALGVAIGIMDVVLQKILVDGVARLAR